MESSLKLARVRGIDIGVHFTWLIVVALVTWSLSTDYFPKTYPHLGAPTYWLLGSISTLLLFVAVLLHELSHSLVAQARGLEVQGITLFVFGGVANIKGEPARPQTEFLIAIAGPITNLVLGGASLATAILVGRSSLPLVIIAEYLAFVNLMLALFNLIPGFPLDGGRVLRSIIWQLTGNLRQATKVAATIGQLAAFGFMFYGFWQAVREGNVLGGIWIAIIGGFLFIAAESSVRQVAGRQGLSGLRVYDAMHPAPITVPAAASLSSLVEDYLLRHNLRGLPVVEGQALVGMVTFRDVKDTPRSRWETTTVSRVMTPRERVRVMQPGDQLGRALDILAKEDLDRLPVLDGERLVGILSRSSVIRLLRLHEDLDAAERKPAGQENITKP